ncbi:MAG: SCO family protein [Gaiellaceae bacterium]
MTETARPVSPRRGLAPRTLALAAAAAAAGGIAGGVVLHWLITAGTAPSAAPALPAFHGQAEWAAGARRAPGFALRDQADRVVSLASLRGRPVLLTFLDSLCRSSCPIEGRQLASVLRRLPSRERPTLVVVSVDPADSLRTIALATRTWGLAGAWRWHWLHAGRAQLAAVWRRYGVTVEPRSGDIVHSLALLLIDKRGYERTAYLFPFLPGFVQGDLARLAQEPAA